MMSSGALGRVLARLAPNSPAFEGLNGLSCTILGPPVHDHSISSCWNRQMGSSKAMRATSPMLIRNDQNTVVGGVEMLFVTASVGWPRPNNRFEVS
jgi:hypothetical protein